MQHIVRFVKDRESTRLKWYVHQIEDSGDEDVSDDYRWYISTENFKIIKNEFKVKYDLKAKIEILTCYFKHHVVYDDKHHVYVIFENAADEAAFIMLAGSDGITVDDYGDESRYE